MIFGHSPKPAHGQGVWALPEPGRDAKAQSDRLLPAIRRAIDEQGSIGFDRYMAMALYHPVLGYYHGGLPKFGAAGDFVTAPEISPLFARCLARQCAQVLEHMAGGDILEFGAGSGVLAAELLAELEKLGTLPRRYLVLELSAELRARQAELLYARLPHLAERVEWLQALPVGFNGVALANEVLDAMPVQCFSLRAQEVIERRVAYDAAGRLTWLERAADGRLRARAADILRALPRPLDDGYRSELNPALGAWIAALAERLSGGLVLIIDYGYPRREYYHPQRRQGTLLCHYRHCVHDDPFLYPGLQDISANVDFTAVAEAGVAAGLALEGYTSLTRFLLSSGLEELYAGAESGLQRLQFSQQTKRLILPSEMGERFQVLALSKRLDLPLRGFVTRDYHARL